MLNAAARTLFVLLFLVTTSVLVEAEKCPVNCNEQSVREVAQRHNTKVAGYRNLLGFTAYMMQKGDKYRCALFPGYYLIDVLEGYTCYNPPAPQSKPPPAVPNSGAYLYEHNNYQGKKLSINKTFHCNFSCIQGYRMNDKISSIAVAPGWKVVTYEHNFSGASFTWKSSNPEIGKHGWNDKISSFSVYAPIEPGVYLYEHNHYQGKKISINKTFHCNFSCIQGYRMNDKISSIEVAPGWKVVTYEHNFSGASFTWRSSNPEIGKHGWNDKISSFSVYAP